MPRKSRRGITLIKPSGAANLSAVTTNWISYGWVTWKFELAHSEADKERLWADVAHEFTEAWSAVYPGTRPFAFWAYSPIPEPRRLLHSVPVPAGHDVLLRAYGAAMMSLDGVVTVESQPTYLKRHNLLGRDELARLTEKDFRPLELKPGEREWLPGEHEEEDDDA